MKEELTTDMHSEFQVDEETEIKHKAFTVWTLCKHDEDIDIVERFAKSYGITLADALKWKDYYFGLRENK